MSIIEENWKSTIHWVSFIQDKAYWTYWNLHNQPALVQEVKGSEVRKAPDILYRISFSFNITTIFTAYFTKIWYWKAESYNRKKNHAYLVFQSLTLPIVSNLKAYFKKITFTNLRHEHIKKLMSGTKCEIQKLQHGKQSIFC